jgi:SnoaL-like polyketide cyclase
MLRRVDGEEPDERDAGGQQRIVEAFLLLGCGTRGCFGRNRSARESSVRGGFPDAHVDLVTTIEEGDMVSFRLDGSGTHLGPFLGVEPTGRTIRIRGIHHVRIRDGRIVEHWQGPDILAMLFDMGLFPPTAEG